MHPSRGAYEDCYSLTSSVLERDPYALPVMAVHLASALQLGRKNDLFIRGHKLAEEYPQQVGVLRCARRGGCWGACLQVRACGCVLAGAGVPMCKSVRPAATSWRRSTRSRWA